MGSRLMDVHEVMMELGCKESKAYAIMRMLNSELEKAGYITITGKVYRAYFYKRLCPDDTNAKVEK